MLSNEQCQFLDPFTDERWEHLTIPRSFWPAEPRNGGPELLEDQLKDLAEAREQLAKEWAKARAEPSLDSHMQQLNLAGTEQKLDADKEGAKSSATRLAELTNIVKITQNDSQRATLIKEYQASQRGTLRVLIALAALDVLLPQFNMYTNL
jgi:hypothetical protein